MSKESYVDVCIKNPIKEETENIKICINGTWHQFEVGRDIKQSDTLSYLLREKMGFTGVKVSCDEGACGSCTVILDGNAVLSCMTLCVEIDGCEVTTVEGLEKDDPVVQAFAEQSEPGYGTAMQCGFCTPGFVMATKAFLNKNSNPNLEEVKEGLAGNLCRCGAYPAIARAVLKAAEINSKEGSGKK